jgi:hypothetical protein
MAADNLLENPKDIETETKDVMSKEVAKNIGLRANSECAPGWGPNREAIIFAGCKQPKKSCTNSTCFCYTQ